jgi:hypothetical protein
MPLIVVALTVPMKVADRCPGDVMARLKVAPTSEPVMESG